MKLYTPEINWHNRDPIYSLDISCVFERYTRIATGSTDSSVRIWSLEKIDDSNFKIHFRSVLERHSKSVNVVRFSPDKTVLASGGDDGLVILWRLIESTIQQQTDNIQNIINLETWSVHKVLASFGPDVYDISWSPDSKFILAGSADNSACVLDVNKCSSIYRFNEAKHYIQGVCWDPLNECLMTISADCALRIYHSGTKKLNFSLRKCDVLQDGKSVTKRMFRDESLPSFFRRCDFSPDGQLFVVPAGISLMKNSDECCTFVFIRSNFCKPIYELPTNGKDSILVRFCKGIFDLSSDSPVGMLNTDYRMTFAVATLDTIIVYSTDSLTPTALISSIHYSGITDLSWSYDAQILLVASSDGFTTILDLCCSDLRLRPAIPFVNKNKLSPLKGNIEPEYDPSPALTYVKTKRRANLTTLHSDVIPVQTTDIDGSVVHDQCNKIRRVEFVTIDKLDST